MLIRTDLEIARTPDEMEELIDSFAEDRQNYPDKAVHRRRGIIKTLLEEYSPLQSLANSLHARSAHLTSLSNQGPDGLVQLESGEEVAVQITVANQSTQEAWGRERLSQGKPSFVGTRKEKNRRSGEIVEKGRVLTTRETRLRGQVKEIVQAIMKKIKHLHNGTDALLVATRISLDDSNIAYQWREDLRQQMSGLGTIPYRKIYVANKGEIIEIIV